MLLRRATAWILKVPKFYNVLTLTKGLAWAILKGFIDQPYSLETLKGRPVLPILNVLRGHFWLEPGQTWKQIKIYLN